MTGSVDVKVFLERLAAARSAGRADVEIDFNRVTHPSSPLPFESLKGVIVYLYLAVVLAVALAGRWGFSANWTVILEVAVGASVVYWILAKRLLENWAKRKIVARLLADGEAWEKLWRFGGVTLRIDGPDVTTWVAPKDSWKDAAERLER